MSEPDETGGESQGGEQVLLLAVGLLDLEKNRVSRTLGATVAGDDVESLEATGSLTELGRIAANWFEETARRPVIGPVGHGAWSFVAPRTTLPPRHRWIRGSPDAK
ncbi:hypothetical protein ACFV23_07005 [Streptomyces sp. NPDC059627]